MGLKACCISHKSPSEIFLSRCTKKHSCVCVITTSLSLEMQPVVFSFLSSLFPFSLWPRCFGEDTCITIPSIDAVVMVLQPSEPRITISGVERRSQSASDFRAVGGIALFQDLHIRSTVNRAETTPHHTGITYSHIGWE